MPIRSYRLWARLGAAVQQLVVAASVTEAAHAAGTGLTTSVVVPVVGSYIATDESQAMLDAVRERTSALPNVRVQQADAVQLPFADGSFDRVLIGNLLHLLPEPSLALAEARRVLAPGGLLIAPTFCRGASWRARIVSRLLGLTGLHTQRRFAGSDFDEMVAAAGFTVKRAVWFRGRLPIRYVSAAKANEFSPPPASPRQIAP